MEYDAGAIARTIYEFTRDDLAPPWAQLAETGVMQRWVDLAQRLIDEIMPDYARDALRACGVDPADPEWPDALEGEVNGLRGRIDELTTEHYAIRGSLEDEIRAERAVSEHWEKLARDRLAQVEAGAEEMRRVTAEAARRIAELEMSIARFSQVATADVPTIPSIRETGDLVEIDAPGAHVDCSDLDVRETFEGKAGR